MNLRNIVLTLVVTCSLSAQNEADDFQKLFRLSKIAHPSDSDIREARRLVRLTQSTDRTIVYQGDTVEIIPTKVLGDMCRKCNTPASFLTYIRYVLDNSGSAEEELSFSMERLFMTNPRLFLRIIDTMSTEENQEIISHIAWGFLGNHWYGDLRKAAGEADQAFIRYDDRKPFLTSANYRKVFFTVNSELRTLIKVQKYSEFINKMLEQMRLEFDQ